MRNEPDPLPNECRTIASEAHDKPIPGGFAQPERLLRLPDVIERVGLKRTAIYQRAKEGRFPKPRSLGTRCTVWVESEVDEWIQAVRTIDL
ncbi:AlpA family transcriptional regulator [Altererythrobacter sp. H2]|jgi:prophage regulatory protein|uniref:helix-turn-helix transcriptional regulator n=1 Tax=Altererythrobacter sp. H2 TaxID=3108391 RepID=UPI002B4C0089|nr:AlpA family transcriptional regulator [Altererythrobacter sp. H2]WRK94660.1 AlpA family transcriptional regulator [Altererythrobacter sp. H2]